MLNDVIGHSDPRRLNLILRIGRNLLQVVWSWKPPCAEHGTMDTYVTTPAALLRCENIVLVESNQTVKGCVHSSNALSNAIWKQDVGQDAEESASLRHSAVLSPSAVAELVIQVCEACHHPVWVDALLRGRGFLVIVEPPLLEVWLRKRRLLSFCMRIIIHIDRVLLVRDDRQINLVHQLGLRLRGRRAAVARCLSLLGVGRAAFLFGFLCLDVLAQLLNASFHLEAVALYVCMCELQFLVPSPRRAFVAAGKVWHICRPTLDVAKHEQPAVDKVLLFG
mmetsp:Transcript_7683/g.16957  ORF Transcript_7683/g.16957 Transcript_7683/m.16957 type:complete len:279 (-) Transcript_7683:471-1307(-)